MIRVLPIAVLLLIVNGLASASGQTAVTGVAGELARVIDAHAASRDVQIRIDQLIGKRRGPPMSFEDRQLAQRLRDAKRRIEAEQIRVAAMQTEIHGLQEAEAGLIPLLHAMLDLLDISIDIDLPFRVQARKQAVSAARRALTSHELSLADRYARTLDAYLTEVRYGYDSEISSARITVSGEPRLVQTLRIGRVALYYLTPDGSQCGLWLSEDAGFAPLGSEDCAVLARAQTTTDVDELLTILPLPGTAP